MIVGPSIQGAVQSSYLESLSLTLSPLYWLACESAPAVLHTFLCHSKGLTGSTHEGPWF